MTSFWISLIFSSSFRVFSRFSNSNLKRIMFCRSMQRSVETLRLMPALGILLLANLDMVSFISSRFTLLLSDILFSFFILKITYCYLQYSKNMGFCQGENGRIKKEGRDFSLPKICFVRTYSLRFDILIYHF